ncbi:class I SAM-dependent methyltransferase [Limnothrix sp. FACHB-708]|uniref:class I SAM-dependent methyltransferase n=1 Tax=unclassified Limnothrix TaxID=2632864 RepID=UPI00081E7477|nr:MULTISPECIES: class I SAM-dependent methyltransferase [unclassified Limnothrix]MBD2553115.1 class I SAM-dependent methyltransferase [Limnothrix sp. FACHB-708]MBD2592253.1 class I SAM-dependent methyltransferase [Limnothrix sp. FACHB-406]OCQ95923.1 hypothetical protein BCR12_16855 [Limnothrix sp. P13C2]PIB14869.1 hypothetical protein AMR42_03720 [Limnothrix sp. PR1529]
MEAQRTAQTLAAVQKLYDTYPFPPEPLLDEPPPGYNWRWNWQAAHQFCTGRKAERTDIRILDAGCGTGVGTEYLMHLNPEAKITAIDLSSEALGVARERCRRTGDRVRGGDRVEFRHLSLYDAQEISGKFDWINCVGVLHHLPDPVRGIQSLAAKLAPGGLMHIFVYGELGRWEIQLMQRAIRLLRESPTGPADSNPYRDGVQIGRSLFAALPETNRLVRREQERWSMENQRDECFADMYVHPQEVDYNIDTLFELIEASGLEFLGFSNPDYWQLDRLLGSNPELMARAEGLSDRQRYRLVESLDPEGATHYEFWLGCPPVNRLTWEDSSALAAALPSLNPCMDGWPSRCLFNQDYRIVSLDDATFQFLSAVAANETADQPQSIAQLLSQQPGFTLENVRSLLDQRLLLLTPQR